MENKKNILFFDIDGTLLEHGKELKPSLINTINRIKENNIVCIATGRSYSTAIDYANQLGIDNLILTNGLHVIIKEKELYEALMTDEDLDYIKNILEPHTEFIGYVSRYGVFIQKSDDSAKVHAQFTGYGEMRIDIVDNVIGENIQKIYINTPNKEDLDKIINLLPDQFTSYRWTDNQCEIQPANFNKAQGIKKFLETIDHNYTTYAFGDGVNDFEMLSFVDNGIAMGNAGDELKKVADDICGSIEDDGLENYLNENF